MSVVFPKAMPGAVPPVIATYRPDPVRGLRADAVSDADKLPAASGGVPTGPFEALWQTVNRTQLPYLQHTRRGQRYSYDRMMRLQLAALGRYLVHDNSGPANYAVNLIADYCTPVTPQAASEDNDWNDENEEAFAVWRKSADFTGRFNFDVLQRIVCKAIDTDGDIGIAATVKRGFPQVRLYETFDIGGKNQADKNDGVIFDDDGVVNGFKVLEGFAPKEVERILTRNQMLLLYDPDLYCRYRGYSPIRRGANDLRDSHDIKGFTKLATKIASALAGVIKGGTVEEDAWGDDSLASEDGGSAPGDEATAARKKLTLAELLGGDIPVIDGDFQSLSHNTPGVNTVDFMSTLNGIFVSGLGMPPAFFLDEKLTGPNVRGVISKAQKKFNNRLLLICQMVEFMWVRFIAWRIENGLTRAVPNWWKVTYQLPSKAVIDLGDQMSNEREDVLVGQMSRQERAGNRGRDWMRDEDQITTEQDYIIESCQKIAEKRKVPLELVMKARGFMGAAKEEAQQAANEKNKEAANKSQEEKK